MNHTFKQTALGLSLILLLAACGTQTPAGQTPAAQNPGVKPPVQAGGFTVDGKSSLVARRVTLPPQQTMTLPGARSLSAQAVSSLPAWTGPILFGGAGDFNFATNSKNELFVGQNYTTPSGYGPGRFSKFSSTGEGIGSKEFDFSESNDSGAPRAGSSWLAVTEGQPERETYQIGTNDRGQLQAQIYSDSTAVLNAAIEPILPMTFPGQAFYGIEPDKTGIKAKGDGFVMSSVNPNTDVAGLNDFTIPVYEAGYEPWKEIGLRVSNVLRPPSAYKSNPTVSRFAVGSDGSVYVAVFTCYAPSDKVDGLCPSVAGITKFTGEDIAWQVYWDADEQVRLRDIAVSDSAVTLLVDAVGSSDYFSAQRSTLQSFSLNGDPISNRILPAIGAVGGDSSTLNGLKTDFSGKMVGHNFQYVFTGTQSGGFTASLSARAEFGANDNNYITNVNFSGDYLYVSGLTYDNLGNPANPLPHSPYDPSSANDTYGDFVLPLDFNLNRRF